MTDTRRGAKFFATCVTCSDGFERFVVGLGIGNQISGLRDLRNQWINDHAASTGHLLFEYADTDYRRLELLVPHPERGLNP